MELKASSPNLGGSSPDRIIDPEEKEVSDEDDRNHKHRRWDRHPQSLEGDPMDPLFTRPYRKHKKPFENGHPVRESESQGGEAWKTCNGLPPENDLTSKFDKRHPGFASITQGNLDLNQRIRSNQTFSGDSGPGKGRGRNNSLWNQHDPRFNLVDRASQMVQLGSFAPSLFARRGFPNVSSAQTPSWSAFGLMPAIPNSSLDTLHPLVLQGALRPPKNPSFNRGIPLQRCRDFEERGFCLRGDMCPMEHGVNRIVVEDVQTLSQFNLPAAVPTAKLLPTPAGRGALLSGFPPTASMNSNDVHRKNCELGMAEEAIGMNSAGSTIVSGADLYDPDQPLWNNNGLETSTALSGLHSPKIDETESLQNDDISDCHHGRLHDAVMGRTGILRTRLDTKHKIDLSSLDCLENEIKEEQQAYPSSQGTSSQVKWISSENDGSKIMDSSLKSQTDSLRNSRKPTQKAQRTLFVNGIPQKSNKRGALLSHFCKFGEVIDIYIPLNSERAFVQFSRREEAEAALKAPDAVMGNRFIKLWWANRDNIPDGCINSGSGTSVTSRGLIASAIPAQPAASRGKDNVQPVPQKSNISHGVDVPSMNSPKPLSMNGPMVPPPLQKKLETLERMKEKLRKKQEMLEQKRNDFRRQLDKLEKQSSGVKGNTEQAAKRQKVGIAADPAKPSTPIFFGPGASAATSCTMDMTDKDLSTENVLYHSPKSKQWSSQSAPVAHPFPVNKYKLDNRPTAFRVISPLPSDLAHVDVLKEHFSQYGDLFSVELEDVENEDDGMVSETLKNCSAHITYSTSLSAERAFVNGKCWQGNNLQFSWLISSNSSNDPNSKETSSSTPKEPLEANDVQTEENFACSISQEVASDYRESADSDVKSFVEHTGLAEVSEHSPSISSVKVSPKSKEC
ncbi:COPII coat assembly protein sec16-like [Hibiscus syriacus]|uniref:COPII coat assembly protein sec16-like n=1 Tax=Hibiscus syriacus TaxID=106335 RepID=A0A6A2ZQA2_HIBSY|nr:zinc finger CCCH domain-containing protein 41-like [Hibiscus syriacus]KAE8694144.1 COPII coat assembly protein sec16-like [Hibiscus syriacus]